MLNPGIYEQVINSAIRGELAKIPEVCRRIAPIDTAEASQVLTQYLSDIIRQGLDIVRESGDGLSSQIEATNSIIRMIAQLK